MRGTWQCRSTLKRHWGWSASASRGSDRLGFVNLQAIGWRWRLIRVLLCCRCQLLPLFPRFTLITAPAGSCSTRRRGLFVPWTGGPVVLQLLRRKGVMNHALPTQTFRCESTYTHVPEPEVRVPFAYGSRAITDQSGGKSKPSSSKAMKRCVSSTGNCRLCDTTGMNAVPSSYLRNV